MSEASDASALRYITESVLALIDGLPDDQALNQSQVVVLAFWREKVFRLVAPDRWHNLQLHAYQLISALEYQGAAVPDIRAKGEHLRQMLVELVSES